MESISEFLKNNDHYLKSCILYEVSLKKPISDSYQTFCGALGKDAMEYWDFEFWYKRFCQGELDFDYDRSSDPVPKTLMDMPVQLMQKIAKELDTFERSALRSVNKAIKDVADSLPPVFESISISWNYHNCPSWKFNNNPATHGKLEKLSNNPGFENLFISSYKNETIYSENGKLEKLSNIPGFKVNNLLLRSYRNDNENKLGDVSNVSFNSKNVDISAVTINEAIQLVSIVKPGGLESIRLWPVRGENFQGFFDTEQFKKAKNVEIMSIKGFDATVLSNFIHLKSFKIKLTGDFVEEDFWKIRETISTFEAFEKCELRIVDDENEFLIQDICEAFGETVPGGPLKSITHRYQCPQSKKCLEFKIEGGGGPRISMKIAKIC